MKYVLKHTFSVFRTSVYLRAQCGEAVSRKWQATVCADSSRVQSLDYLIYILRSIAPLQHGGYHVVLFIVHRFFPSLFPVHLAAFRLPGRASAQ